MTAVKYNIKNYEELANTVSFNPSLVKVITDSNGNITDMKELECLCLGLYISDNK